MRTIALLMACTFLIFSQRAMASEQTGYIQSIQAATDGRIMIFMQNSRSGKPACATYDYWFIADENSTAGKTQIAMLLAAQAAGRQVQIYGTGSCIRWVDGENIGYVRSY